MRYRDPLKEILTRARSYWDQPHTRPAVRRVFLKALQCRTAELGAEVYSSEDQELVLYHPCKSRACPSCGYRAMIQWLRERRASLPEHIYKGITLTMPDLLWPLFHDNPHLATALPALAARVIQIRVTARYGVRVGVIAILHTFNGQMKFNSHIHTMVTGGGLVNSGWLSSVYYDPFQIRRAWREAVIELLRTALGAGCLRTTMSREDLQTMLDEQERRPWRIKIQSFNDRGHFLHYAGRYGRRPPIAQRRITWIGNRSVRFWYKDKKLRRRVEAECSLESSWTGGRSTFQTVTSMASGISACLLPGRSDRPALRCLGSWDNPNCPVQNLGGGRSQSSVTSDAIRYVMQKGTG